MFDTRVDEEKISLLDFFMHRPMQKKYADQAAHGLSNWQRAGEDDLSTRFVIILENLHELDVITNKKHAIFYCLLRGTHFLLALATQVYGYSLSAVATHFFLCRITNDLVFSA